MPLPFTHDQFLDVFGTYNNALWPAEVVLWIATAIVAALLASGRPVSRSVSWLLAFHWLVAGAVYHLMYFRAINPAALAFGVAFLIQAALLAGFGAIRPRLTFERGTKPRHFLGLALVVYAMAYPALVLASGLHWPRLPLFAVPCPTTLLTIGCLLMVPPRQARVLSVIPILWSGIAGASALALGVIPDLMLLVAGVLLLVHVAWPRVLDNPYKAGR